MKHLMKWLRARLGYAYRTELRYCSLDGQEHPPVVIYSKEMIDLPSIGSGDGRRILRSFRIDFTE